MTRPAFNLPVLLAALLVLAAACAPPAALPADEPAPTVTPAPPATGTAAPPSETEPAAVTPTARPGLVASDPTTVQLASGGPTLVEFFAFW